MREAHRNQGPSVRVPHRTASSARSPYFLDDTTFTLQEIRRWRGYEVPA